MRPAVLVGIVLIVVGILALAYQGFSYTKEKKVIDLGPIQASTRTRKTVPIPPIVGSAALIGGVALVVIGSKRS
jgi:hypothetical protein